MSWPMARLGDCCDVKSGATPKTDIEKYWGGEIRWATPKDISRIENPYLFDTPDKITAEGYRSCSTQLLPVGTVLVSSRAPIGLVAIAGVEMCTNQGFKNLVPGPDVHSNYLYHCMKANSGRLATLGNGATFKEVSKSIVENFQIPLPPVQEQIRIAAILDKTDSIRRKRQEAIRLAHKFLQAMFTNMFGDPETNAKSFLKGTIRDLVSSANYGTSEKASEQMGQYPILRMNNITYGGGWDFSSLKYVDLDEASAHKYMAQKGDLLFNRTNSKELVGKTAVYMQDEPMAIAGYLVRVRMNERGNPHYVSGYLNSTHGKRTLEARAKSIVGMANINAQEMQDIPILLPPIELQDKFASIVSAMQERLRKHHTFSSEAAALNAALTERFFSQTDERMA
jgi:type I restriction enzyme S subunit